MTMASNAFSTYIQTGIKENVSNLITTITPTDTPFFSTVKKFTVTDRLYQWQTDALAVPAANAQLEGDVVSGAVAYSSATTMLTNRTQISYKSLGVTNTSRAVATYGREDEYDYQIMKRGRELRLDVEFNLLRNTAKDAGGTTTSRTLAGLPTWITNVAYGTAPAGTGTNTSTAGTSTVMTYAMCSSAVTLAYEAGGEPTVMMLPPSLKKRFSGLAFSATPSTADVRFEAKEGRAPIAIGTVDRWMSDFGTLDVVPNRVMSRSADAFLGAAVFLLDTTKARVGFLQNFTIEPLAKRGLADEAMIFAEYTLEVSAPNAHAAIYGVT